MCAERTTYSFFNPGSEPGSLATRFADATGVLSMAALALSETESGKCGSGLRSLPSAAISAKVWPEPAKSFSAEAGLKATPSWSPGVSRNSGSARSMEGSLWFAEMRDQSRGNVLRRAREVNSDLAIQIEASQFVEILLGDFQAVADKHQRRFEIDRGARAAGTDEGIVSEG